MSDFKFCPHCGSGLATQGDFCGSCGELLRDDSQDDDAVAGNNGAMEEVGVPAISDKKIALSIFGGGMALILLICLYFGRYHDDPWASISLECEVIGNQALQCSSRNRGLGKGALCFDASLVCDDGRHTARSCTPAIEPWKRTAHVVDGFVPAVTDGSVCFGLELENSHLVKAD